MSEAALFRDFAVVLLAAGATALVFYYLRQPVVLGYLLAGFLVGPFSPGPAFTSEGGEFLSVLGEMGIVFLLFALGLEFNLRKLRRVGAKAIVAGTIEIVLMLGLGYALGRAFGWTPLESVFLGAVMSISSTTIIVKVLAELGHKDKDWAQLAFGILIIEDILAVLILTALSSAGATGNFQPEQLGGLAYRLVLFLGAALVVGLLAAPRIVDRLAALEVEEVRVVLATGIGFGMALLASQLGFSPGLGAFVAGALMAESAGVARIEPKIEPLRDLFTAIFFVTVGAQLDPAVLAANWSVVLAVALAVVLGKVATVTVGAFVAGVAPERALRIGMTMAQIGEFAFVIAALGASLAVAPPALFPVAIAVSALTAFSTPFLVRASPGVVGWMSRRAPAGIHAYAATYGAWVERLRRSGGEDDAWRQIRRSAIATVLSIAVLVPIFAAGALLADELAAFIGGLVPVPLPLRAAAWIALSLVAAPFVLVLARSARAIVVTLARLAVPARLRGAEVTMPERLLRRTFGLAATGLAAALLILVGGLFVENIVGVALIALVGVVVSTALLGRSLGGYHREVERTLDRVLRGDEGEGARQEAMHLIESSGAWGAGHREVVLPAVSGGGGRTLGELRLRELTGASVVRLVRAGEPDVLGPDAGLRFRASDRVVLVGDEEALTRAQEVLLGRDLGVEGGATELRIEPGWGVAGRTLRDARLAESTGAMLLVVRRGDTVLEADGDLVLLAGDVLVVSGTEGEVARLAERARGRGGKVEPDYG